MDLSPLKIDRSATRKKTRRGGFPWIRAFLLAALVGAGFLFRDPIARKIDALRLPKVTTSQVYRPDARAAAASTGTAANGYIIAKTRAALSADTPGRIVELNVEEGTVMQAGDVVARLYSAELEAALEAASARVAATEASIASAHARVTSAEAVLPDLEAQVTVAKTRVSTAKAAIGAAEAVAALARQERERAQALFAGQAGTQERLDRAISEQERSSADLERIQAEVVTQEAGVTAASAALERARADVGTASAAVLEAQAQLPVQEALREQAAATLAKTVVRAPFDGVVVLKDAEVGEVVSPNSQGASSRGSVATMVDFDSLEVQVELPETSISAVTTGGPAQIFLDAFPRKAYAGRVDRVWPTANRQKGTIEVRIAILEPDDELRPEMGVRVTFPAEGAVAQSAEEEPSGPAALRVVSSAIVELDGRAVVFLLERGTVRAVPVTLGEVRGTQTEVLDGLKAGDNVIAAPAADLNDGDRVQVLAN